ncbi:hypothetical protein AB0082_26745, partial [Klebsiella pneumoniae]
TGLFHLKEQLNPTLKKQHVSDDSPRIGHIASFLHDAEVIHNDLPGCWFSFELEATPAVQVSSICRLLNCSEALCTCVKYMCITVHASGNID